MTTLVLKPPEYRVSARAAARPLCVRELRECDRCPIRPLSICAALGSDGLATLEALGREVSLRPRAQLFTEGERAEAVFNVTAGLMRLFRVHPDGRRQVVGFALPGDFLGLPPDECYSFSADAAGPTKACRFGRKAFSDLLDERPELMRRVHESAERALATAHDQMMLLGHRRAEGKIAAFLLGLRDRWARIYGASRLVPLPMGREDIGDFLGLSIATVSRTLNRIARQRLIVIVPGGVRILDFGRLERIAEPYAV